MARKIKRPSSSKKSDAKITGIIIAVAFIIFLGFVFMHKSKEKNIAPKPRPIFSVKKVPIVHKPIAPKVVDKKPVPKNPINEKPITKPVPPGKKHGKIAFVIDDWGYTTRNCKYLNEIKSPLAIAILPDLRKTIEVEKCSASAGKDVMLHLPLEPYVNHDHYPENYIISSKMKPNLVEKIIEDAIKKMPNVIGVNNHMGSKALENRILMKLVLKTLKKHNLFFMDSMTSPNHSVGEEIAGLVRIPFAQRDVFLDNVNTREAILKQFDELAIKAEKQGHAIAICHDRELTMQILKEEILILQAQGFEIVSIKELLKLE